MTDHKTNKAPELSIPLNGLSAVEEAVGQRRSVRAFKPDPVPRETVERILMLAARAPSGTNMQPWRAHVLTGAAKDRVSASVLKAFDDPDFVPKSEYNYYPDTFPEPYLARRRKVGWDLYGLLGIAKGDKDRMHASLAFAVTQVWKALAVRQSTICWGRRL